MGDGESVMDDDLTHRASLALRASPKRLTRYRSPTPEPWGRKRGRKYLF